jgi:LacI family repressor for deo operon, udp, cdd, tsx, nupC, and nupG
MDQLAKGFRSEGRASRIRDVAQVACVSTATVSRALAFPERVSEATRLRVLDAVRILHYTPNQAARALRVGATRMALVVSPYQHSGSFFNGVINAIDAELASAGYVMIAGSLDGPIEKARRLVDLVYARQIDGVILLVGSPPVVEGRSLLDAGTPVVAICAPLARKDIPAATIDDEGCARQQLRHLYDLGHRRFAYVAGPADHYAQAMRWRGVQSEAAARRIPADDLVRLPGDYTLASGALAARSYLELEPRPTGVICCSDEMAIGFIKVVTKAGLRVPHDLSVVGFDGIPFAEYCEPSLTTIVQPRAALGAAGARALLRLIREPATLRATRVELKAELRIGGSTGPAPVTLVPVKPRRILVSAAPWDAKLTGE